MLLAPVEKRSNSRSQMFFKIDVFRNLLRKFSLGCKF